MHLKTKTVTLWHVTQQSEVDADAWFIDIIIHPDILISDTVLQYLLLYHMLNTASPSFLRHSSEAPLASLEHGSDHLKTQIWFYVHY